MRMTVTKVKPTVVKHIMPDEVMSIYDIKVSFHYQQQGSECSLTVFSKLSFKAF